MQEKYIIGLFYLDEDLFVSLLCISFRRRWKVDTFSLRTLRICECMPFLHIRLQFYSALAGPPSPSSVSKLGNFDLTFSPNLWMNSLSLWMKQIHKKSTHLTLKRTKPSTSTIISVACFVQTLMNHSPEYTVTFTWFQNQVCTNLSFICSSFFHP